MEKGVTDLQIARFDVPSGELPEQMAHSDGRGLRLLKLGPFGADLIRFAAGRGVREHTHPGDHILIVTGGTGWVDYDGVPYRLEPGVCYLVPGSVPHAIRAETELTLISVASDHRDVASEERLTIVQRASANPV